MFAGGGLSVWPERSVRALTRGTEKIRAHDYYDLGVGIARTEETGRPGQAGGTRPREAAANESKERCNLQA